MKPGGRQQLPHPGGLRRPITDRFSPACHAERSEESMGMGDVPLDSSLRSE
jgi:hypothetical protein